MDQRQSSKDIFEKVTESMDPFLYDLRYPVAQLYLWYQSFQTLMKWIGAIAAGMLTFTTSILLGDALQGSIDPNVVLSNVHRFRWAFIMLGACLLTVLFTLLVTYNWFIMSLRHAARTMHPAVQLLQSIVDSGGRMPQDMPDELKGGRCLEDDPFLDGELAQEFISYGGKFHMRFFGILSYLLGGLAGILLVVGVVIYVVSAWAVVRGLL